MRQVFYADLFKGITRLHNESHCLGAHCVIHNPSRHLMTLWQATVDWTVIYRLCAHGEPHVDPDSAEWADQAGVLYNDCFDCDGCCGCDPLDIYYE